MTNKYHQKNKERLRKEARERYQNLSEEQKIGKKKVQELYQNFTEEEKEEKHRIILNVIKIFLRNKSRS